MKNVKIVVGKNEEKLISFVWIGGNFMLPRSLASEAQTSVKVGNEINLNVDLVGDGASLKLIGIFLGTGKSSVIFNTNVIHKAPHTKSLTHIRGVFYGSSNFNNDGMVHIAKGAKGADGYFASKILLFDDAKGRSVPSLEIDENDLKAGHASTVGRPDNQQLFYLRSRGLSEKEAEKIIVKGFFESSIKMLEVSDQKKIKKQLLKSL